MSTLLLRFAGPMQAWGTESHFDIRRTNREPTRSGVIGFLASALGLRRDAPLDELNALRFGIRVDREGVLMRDLHTARKDIKTAYLTTRYYLCDAVFLVGLYSDDEALMQKLEQAVLYPAHPLFLGRRSCPPEGRISLGLRTADLKTALEDEPCLVKEPNGKHSMRIVLDDPNGRAKLRDLPLSFSPLNRQYAFRSAREFWHNAENEHDPMQELR